MDDARKGKWDSGGHYVTFGIHATAEELEQIYTSLMSETDETTQTRLLWVFRRAKLPYLHEELFAWANGAKDELRAATLNALSQISDRQVHALARMKTKAGTLMGADCDVFNLFLHNYDSSDAFLITQSLVVLLPNPDDAHSLGYSIRQIAEKYNDPNLVEAMRWVYENTPCGFCRYQVITWLNRHGQFDDMLRFECQYDAEEDIREVVLLNNTIDE